MRLSRLDLVRFGHFTDASIPLPAGPRDLHLVFGPNEAGKTTTMAAIEDLLFGIPVRTPYNFRHENRELRLGAVIEAGGRQFEFRRRKGTKNTVLGPDDEPLNDGEERLREFLGDADRAFFGRMFNLDRERLSKGGKAILDARDEVGQALFSAGSGLLEFRQRRQRLDEEARALWSPRRSRKAYYEALEGFKAADHALREAVRRPKEWTELEQAVGEAERKRNAFRRIYDERSADSRKFHRIWRVSPLVRLKRDLDRELADLAEAPLLPAGAATEVAEAEAATATATAQIGVLEKQLRKRQETLDRTPLDEGLLGARETIQAVRERRITVRQMRRDLPKRRGELSEAFHRLRQAGNELGWEGLDDEALLARVPTKRRVESAQRLLVGHGAVETRWNAARDALERVRRELAEYSGRENGTASLPDPETVRAFGDRLDARAAEVRSAGRHSRTLRDQAARRRAEREQRIGEGQVVPPESLERAREGRDALWRVIARHLAGDPVPDARPDLVPTFAAAVREADAVADRRFDRAEAAGRLAKLDQTISDLEADVGASEEAEVAARAELAELESAWRALWDGCPFEPKSPPAMLDWLARRDDLIAAAGERLRQRDEARARLSDWEADWRVALSELGLDPATAPDRAAEPLDRLAGMREDVVRVRELRDKRIGTIERDIAAFEAEVGDLVGSVAPELAALPVDDAAARLGARLDDEIARQKDRGKDERDIHEARKEITVCRQTLREAESSLVPLRESAGAPDLAGLKIAIQRSDRKRNLERERGENDKRLRRDGDELPFEELARECEALGPDEARERWEAAENDRVAARRQTDEAAERVGSAQAACEAFRRREDATARAAERQDRLAALTDTAERYARARASVILLDWALDHYRQERQGPMLRRAGELFRLLTRGSFARLEFGFDAKDRLQLNAVRPGGEAMDLSGLSSGAEDQLFLALRVAAVEDYVGRAVALPFIADDLVVDFDDERAAAGFEVLGQLAQRTQVLFFTHHEHLVEIARQTLGNGVPVVRLGSVARAPS